MKRLLLVLLGVSLLSFGNSLIAQDLEKVLKNHFKAIGQDKLLKINTITMNGKILQGGMEFPLKMLMKRPKMLRIESDIQGQTIVQVFDGENGWMINPMMGTLEPQNMDAETVKQLKSQANIDGELYNYKEKGHKIEDLGTDEIEGTKVYKFKFTGKEGNETTYFIDANTYLIVKTITKRTIQGVEMDSENTYSNYKTVKGISFPFQITSSMSGQPSAQVIMDTVILDEPIADSLYIKPQ
jgi:hypothetical protein